MHQTQSLNIFHRIFILKVTQYLEKITGKSKILHQITKLLSFFFSPNKKNFTRNIKIFHTKLDIF